MRTVLLSALLVVLPALCHGVDDPPVKAPVQQTPDGQPPVQSPKATIPAAPTAPDPAVKPALDTDPAKLAAPPAGTPPAGAAAASDKSYIIGAEDVLGIVVWGNAQLSGVSMVRPDGKITIGLIGDITASGMSPQQLGTEIATRLRDGGYLRAPQVIVQVNQINSKKITIIGEVAKPGLYNLLVPTTVLEALVNAGGFKDFANQKKIIIERGTKRFNFNYKRAIAGKDRDKNILLEPGDMIIVK